MHRMFKSAFVVGAVATSLILGSIQPAVAHPVSPSNQAAPGSPDRVNKALEDFAISLARTLPDASVRSALKAKIGERFDGDEEVLYSSIADTKFADGKALKQKLAAGYARASARTSAVSEHTAQQILSQHAALLPRLQFAMPVGFEQWNAAAYTPLVAFMPEGVEDTSVTYVKAFDAQGNVHLLDAQNAPNFPVMVVSLNERTETTKSGGTMNLSRAYGTKEILHSIKINNDHEPWPKGSPEIFMNYSFPDNVNVKGRFNMSGVDDEGKWYYLSGHLFYWQQFYGDLMMVWLWEDDGGNSITINASFQGINFSTTVTDGDDELGHNPVTFFDPSPGYYSVGDGEYYLRYE